MTQNQFRKNLMTVAIAVLGIGLMVTAPIFSTQLLSGFLFFLGAALTLSIVIVRTVGTLTDEPSRSESSMELL